jgi:hypothetical protein
VAVAARLSTKDEEEARAEALEAAREVASKGYPILAAGQRQPLQARPRPRAPDVSCRPVEGQCSPTTRMSIALRSRKPWMDDLTPPSRRTTSAG